MSGKPSLELIECVGFFEQVAITTSKFSATKSLDWYEFCKIGYTQKSGRVGAYMECILNHCTEHIAQNVAVISFYGTATGLMIVFAFLSQSKTIHKAALMIAGVWLLTVFYYLHFDGPSFYIFSITLDGVLAYLFWRMSKAEIFPAILCCLMIIDIAITTAKLAFWISDYWTIFILNRTFELSLIYIAGAAIYRIRKLKPPEREFKKTGGNTLKFITG